MTLTDRLTDRPTDRANIVQSALFEGWKIEGRDLQKSHWLRVKPITNHTSIQAQSLWNHLNPWEESMLHIIIT